MSPVAGVSEGLLERFRAAGARVAWRDAPTAKGERRRRGSAARIAHLHDEEARVESSPSVWTVESGPVGALLLLLEVDRRGPPSALVAHAAGARPGFGQGAIEASWEARGPRADRGSPVPLADLVELARYALA